MSDTATEHSEPCQPLGLALTDLLGPLPEADMRHQKARDDLDEEESYSAEAMDAERRRCYALGVAAEREQWEYALRVALAGLRGLEELMNRA